MTFILGPERKRARRLDSPSRVGRQPYAPDPVAVAAWIAGLALLLLLTLPPFQS